MTSQPLQGLTIALSISNAPDMEKLGYPEREVDRVLLSVCGTLIRAGARIAYGGNLSSNGYTFKIFRHLAKAYAVRHQTAPFIHYIPEPILRQASFAELREYLMESNGIIEAIPVLDGKTQGKIFGLDDSRIGLRKNENAPFESLTEQAFSDLLDVTTATAEAQAYTQMRKLVSEHSHARIIMGGKMGLLHLTTDKYSGSMPGVIEETIYTLQNKKMAFVFGAFGGAARDIAIALGLLSADGAVARKEQMQSYRTAIAELEELRSAIPESDVEKLSMIAGLDRAETLGYEVVRLLASKQVQTATA